MNQRERILEATNELFFQYGVKSFTMDDLAKELGISKKTIYEVFENKNELVKEVMNINVQFGMLAMEAAVENAIDAMDAMLKVMNVSQSILTRVNPKFIHEIQKYYPKAWMLYKEFRDSFAYNIVHDNLERGITEGLYREDIDVNLLTYYRLEDIDLIFNPKNFPSSKFNIASTYLEISKCFILGISTMKGHKLFDSYKNQFEEATL
ncbi:MAG: AcrR family transcriptional regulator [Sphingobacteriales bacterium]|jgi:AcrR family transcriptional regulator